MSDFTIPDEAVDAYDRAHGNYEGNETSICRREAAAIRAGLVAAYSHLVMANGLSDVARHLQATALRETADDIERIAREPVELPAPTNATTTHPDTDVRIVAYTHPRHVTGMLAAASITRRRADKLDPQ